MQNFVFLLALLAGVKTIFADYTKKDANGGVSGKGQTRVLNGVPVQSIHSRPYVAQVFTTVAGRPQTRHGAVIDEYTILTTAHHVNATERIIAGKYYFNQTGEYEQEGEPCFRSEHPDAGTDPVPYYNYGLIHLKEPLIFNENVQPIKLAEKGDEPNGKCWMIGWGRVEGYGYDHTPELRETVVTFRDQASCLYDHETVACVDKGGCWSDWGAPVVCKDAGVDTLYAEVGTVYLNCENQYPHLSWIPMLPRDWLSREQEKAAKVCGRGRPPPPRPTTPGPPPLPTTPGPPPVPTTTEPAATTAETGPAPPPGTAQPPPPPPPPQAGECECRFKGYCQTYYECLKYPNGTSGWEYRGNCTANLYWNPHNITGGFCDYFQNLPGKIQEKYRSDPTCFHCDWFQELADVCSPRYTYRDQNLKEHKLSCPPTPPDRDPLYWHLDHKTCDLCYNTIDSHGVPCQCS